jgi:hypothetical protein
MLPAKATALMASDDDGGFGADGAFFALHRLILKAMLIRN